MSEIAPLDAPLPDAHPRDVACDVVVVGLGPAGATAAAVAARAGLSVVAIERKTVAGEPVQCAEFVPRSLATEIPDLAGAVVQPIAAMETYLGDGDPVRTPLPGHVVDRAVFDRRLAERAIAAGARALFGTAVTACDADGLRLADGTRLRPRVIVGADGPKSLVGRAIGRENRIFAHTRQITVPLTRPHDATDIFLGAEYPGGYGWLFPKGAVANLGLGLSAQARADLPARLAALHARLVAEGRVEAEIGALTGGLLPAGGLIDPAAELGAALVLLAGDAAGLTNPITGAGIASAVISGRMAGEAAIARIAGRPHADADYREEIADLFGPALERACRRHRDLAAAHAAGGPSSTELRRGWVAFDDYWTDAAPAGRQTETGVAA